MGHQKQKSASVDLLLFFGIKNESPNSGFCFLRFLGPAVTTPDCLSGNAGSIPAGIAPWSIRLNQARTRHSQCRNIGSNPVWITKKQTASPFYFFISFRWRRSGVRVPPGSPHGPVAQQEERLKNKKRSISSVFYGSLVQRSRLRMSGRKRGFESRGNRSTAHSSNLVRIRRFQRRHIGSNPVWVIKNFQAARKIYSL